MLATLAAFDDMEGFFKDKNIEVLYPGQKAFIRLDAFPTKGYNGTVKNVANVASQADFLSSDVKVYQTIVSIEGRVENLKPGMSAEVTILADQSTEPVISVPIEAVVGTISMGTKRKCFVLDDANHPIERDVSLGLSNNKVVEVREGLQVGDRVVQNPAPLLKGERSQYKITIPGGRRGVEFEESGKKGTKKGGAPGVTPKRPEAPFQGPGPGPGGPGAIPKRPENMQ